MKRTPPATPSTVDTVLAGRVALSIEEAARALGVSRDTIERELSRGTLKAFRVGSRRRVTVDSIRQLIRSAA